MKSSKSILATGMLFVLLTSAWIANADDNRRTGYIEQINVSQRIVVVKGDYFRLATALVVHAPASGQSADIGDLTTGTKVSLHLSPSAQSSPPVVDEVWIEVD